MLKVKVLILDEKAAMPVRAHDTDSGYDLKMIEVSKIKDDVVFFRTGIAVQPPAGYYFEVFPRSSISKLPLELANSIGVIDETYTGEIIIPVRFLNPTIESGEKKYTDGIVNNKVHTIGQAANIVLVNRPVLFQMILRKRYDAEFEQVDSLTETERGDGGFGSTNPKETK